MHKFSLKESVVCSVILLSLGLLPPVGAAECSRPEGNDTSVAASALTQLRSELPSGVRPCYQNVLAVLYHAHNMQPMWQDRQAMQQFQQQLAEVAISGVQPQFIRWVQWLTNPDINGMARDIVLSDAMLGYLHFTAEAPKQGEKWLYNTTPYKLALPADRLISQWQQAVKQGNSNQFITDLAPRHPQYQPMRKALKALLVDNAPWPQIHSRETLRPGQVSQDMPALREILKRSGMLSSATTQPSESSEDSISGTLSVAAQGESVTIRPPAAGTDARATALAEAPPDDAAQPGEAATSPAAVYAPDLVAAVKRFQHWQGLESDGIIGPRTREWLNVSPQRRAALLALNIQRLRLLPDDMHNGIMVNIARFSLTYYRNGNPILTSRVIVGRPARKTPLMRSALNNVVLNPPWNVPTSLARQDIVPRMKSDPAYLWKHNYQLLSGWGSDAQVVDPTLIDWSMVSASDFPYRIRQVPGATNALGRYKFNMPSSEAIYLHDTPNHNLFQRDSRDLSSGCVRVNKAPELANLLLRDAGWNNARISASLKEGNTRYVPVRHRIPVNLYYLTAWVADDGRAQFRTDIYNYDRAAHAGVKVFNRAGQLLM